MLKGLIWLSVLIACGDDTDPPTTPDAAADAEADVEGDAQPGDTGVTPPPPTFAIDVPQTGVRVAPGDSIEFEATCTPGELGQAIEHRWDFGTVAPAAAVEDPAPIAFADLGDYVVTYFCAAADRTSDPDPASVTVHVVAPEWVPLVGRLTANDRYEFALTNVALSEPRFANLFDGGWPADEEVNSSHSPSISPDHRWVAFATETDTGGIVYVVDLQAEDPRAISVDALVPSNRIYGLEWAPTSDKIAYRVRRADRESVHIADIGLGPERAFVLNPMGMGQEGRFIPAEGSAWSADSRFYYYIEENRNASTRTPYSFDTTDSLARPRNLLGALDGSVFLIRSVGDSIAVFFGYFPTRKAFYAINVDAPLLAPPTRLLDGAPDPVRLARPAATSADQNFFAFTWFNSGQLELYRVDFSSAIPAADSALRLSPSSTGPAVRFEQFEWAPTGSTLLIRATVTAEAQRALFLVGHPDETPRRISETSALQGVGQWAWSPDGQGIVFTYGQFPDYSLQYVSRVGASGGTLPIRLDSASPPAVDYALWLDNSQVLFLQDENVFVVEASESGMATRLNADEVRGTSSPFGTSRIQGRDGLTVTADRSRLIGLADWREGGTREAIMFDPSMPQTHREVHPSLVGTPFSVWVLPDFH